MNRRDAIVEALVTDVLKSTAGVLGTILGAELRAALQAVYAAGQEHEREAQKEDVEILGPMGWPK